MNKGYLKRNWREIIFGLMGAILSLSLVLTATIDTLYRVQILPFSFFIVGMGVLLIFSIFMIYYRFYRR